MGTRRAGRREWEGDPRRRGAEGLAGFGERSEHCGEVVSTRGSQPEQAGLPPSRRRYQRLQQARVPGDTVKPQPSLPDADLSSRMGEGPSALPVDVLPGVRHRLLDTKAKRALPRGESLGGSEAGDAPFNPTSLRAGVC